MKTKQKKKISEMSVDEFMEHGFDTDDNDVEGEEERTSQSTKIIKLIKTNKNALKESNASLSESSQHKNQIDRLKEKDPEFYKFLQENDENLLAFSGSDEDSEKEEMEEEADQGNLDCENENGVQSEDDESSEDGTSERTGECEKNEELEGKVVDPEMIKKWKKNLQIDSVKTLKCVFNAFHVAVEHLSPDDEDKISSKVKKSKYIVQGGTMFNNLVALCFKHSVEILEKYLHYSKTKKAKKIHLPSSSKQWVNVKMHVKQYLMDVLQLLRQLTDTTMLTITLRQCQSLCPYYACFPKITKMLLKRLVRMWSSGDEHVRVLAFLCIRKLSMLVPTLFEFVMKKLYLSFVRNSKFVNMINKPTLMFMRNSLVEIFGLNESVTYRHAFVYIRQLAIHLRNAITVKKKDAHQSVYNWQYISCLQLWTQVLSELHGEVLKPLIYPVVQITLGVVRLIPAARYYPLRFHCIGSLNYLSEKTDVYIPMASLVLEVLESKEFQKKPKSSEKPPDFSGILKLSKTQLQTKGFQDVTIDMAFEALLKHYVHLSNSIAFPEVVFPVCHRLKHLVKTSKVFKLCKDMKVLVEKLQCHADLTSKERSKVNFSPKDIDDVRKWEQERVEKKNSLIEFYETWQRMRNLCKDDFEVKEKLKPPKRKKPKVSDKKDVNTEVAKKKKKENTSYSSHEEDIVEDFEFSDDESS